MIVYVLRTEEQLEFICTDLASAQAAAEQIGIGGDYWLQLGVELWTSGDASIEAWLVYDAALVKEPA